jgi:nucleotide-binding universal stress UspA family protein
MSTIVLAWDLDADGRHAADAAFALARIHGARLSLVYVPQKGGRSEADARRGFEDEIRRRQEAGGWDVVGQTEIAIRPGEFPEAITEHAIEQDAELVVFGPNRRGGARTTLIGTTPERVLRGTRSAVLLVPQALRVPPRHILVPVDRHRASWSPLPVIGRWILSRERAEVSILRVSELSKDHPPDPLLSQKVEDELRAALGVPAADETGSGTVVNFPITSDSTAQEGILRTATELGPSLVAMSTSASGVLGRFAFGSVASDVTRRIDRPLLLVPQT